MNIIEIKDFEAKELDIYARLSEGQLLNRAEPDKGIFIAESPKVIERALDAGYEPISCLIEKKHIEGEGKVVLEKCDRIYQNRKIYSDAEKQENLVLKNNRENTVSEEKYALKSTGYKEKDIYGFPVYTAEFGILTKLTGFKLTRGMLCAMHRRQLPALEEICKDARRIAVLENVMKAAEGKLTVIAHVACNNTKDSQELAKHAESLGVDAIAAIPPIYFHLPEYAIAKYWNDISAAAPNTDFVIYNIPQLAGVALTMNLFAEMRKNPRVIGVKNSSMPVQDIQMFKAAAGEDYVIFNGPDEQFMSGRVIGAEGAIGGTYGVMPELFLKLNEHVIAGEMEKARELQYAVNEIIYKMCSAHGNMYGVIKAMLKINEGLELGGVREPLPALIESDMAIVEEAAKMVRDAKEKFL